MTFLTKRRMRAIRAVPTLLRVLMDTIPTSAESDKGLRGTLRCVWPTMRTVERLWLDWPDWPNIPDVERLVFEVTREARRMGLVKTTMLTDFFGRGHLAVGLLPEERRDCDPAPEALEQRRAHCRENCEGGPACRFVNPGPESV